MYKILNQSGETEILLYSLIQGGETASKVIKALKDIDPASPITLRINSDGGEVFDAIAIYNYLKDRNVSVIIDGICASAATIVAMAGKSITMKTGSLFMIHKPLTFAIGNADDLKAAAEVLDKITDSVIAIYQTKTTLSREDLLDAMTKEQWLSAQEAFEYGFVDFIDETPDPVPEPETADRFDEGVRAERERLKALDELYTPGRARTIEAAKYKTFKDARDVAVEILKAEAKLAPAVNGISLPPGHRDNEAINAFAQTIERKRGL